MKIQQLVHRFVTLIGERKLTGSTLETIENKLQIDFSIEFKKLSELSCYAYFSKELFSIFDENQDSVISETLRLRRNENLPLDTLFLSEDDASLLLMKCLGDHEEIYWIAIEDFENYCQGKPLQYNPTIFSTFADFFEYLLNEEEKIRGLHP